jgi:hypothetical protein
MLGGTSTVDDECAKVIDMKATVSVATRSSLLFRQVMRRGVREVRRSLSNMSIGSVVLNLLLNTDHALVTCTAPMNTL